MTASLGYAILRVEGPKAKLKDASASLVAASNGSFSALSLSATKPLLYVSPSILFNPPIADTGLHLTPMASRGKTESMKARFPEERVRLEHIFTRQLYAMAPTKIIHRIVLAYLLDFDPDLRKRAEAHIVLADAAKAAQAGALPALAQEVFG